MFSCEICEIFKNTYFEEYLQNDCFCSGALGDDIQDLCKNSLRRNFFTDHQNVSLLLQELREYDNCN